MEELRMTFRGHLDDLRWTLVRVGGVLFALAVLCFCLMPWLFDRFVLAPASPDFPLYRWLSETGVPASVFPDFGNGSHAVEIVNTDVSSQLLTHVSASFWVALVLLFPYLIFEAWRFVRPALVGNEQRSVRLAFIGGTGLFFVGCAVGYLFVFPFMFRFLTEYQLSSSIVNQISLNSYMRSFLLLVFVMGVALELPLLTWSLSRAGLATRTFFRRYRRQAAVVLLLLTVLVTPSGDPFVLLAVFLPLYLLYELGIRFARE